MRYSVIITPEPDESAYNVTVPALPGCNTWGQTFEQVVARAREAIALYVESLTANGRPIPVETGLLLVTIEVDAA